AKLPTGGLVRCHHCEAEQLLPRVCPVCSKKVTVFGWGTQRVEEELNRKFPGLKYLRMDSDVMRTGRDYDLSLESFRRGEVDLLVGTQMIAKGHDFRRVTLVAAVNPDAALFAADFRAPERLFALLMQAAGRAGRDADHAARSEMWVQTWHPTHPLYAALRAHDFAAFAASQLAEREAAGLPPYSHLALLRAEARTQEAARDFLQAASDAADAPAAIALYAPVPVAVQRVADVERAQLLVESVSRPALQRFLAGWLPALHALRAAHKSVLRWAIDVDPLAI
ncbi:MAG TPA: helicase-related protein, partial [Burkholderiaceae bacterium]